MEPGFVAYFGCLLSRSARSLVFGCIRPVGGAGLVGTAPEDEPAGLVEVADNPCLKCLLGERQMPAAVPEAAARVFHSSTITCRMASSQATEVAQLPRAVAPY